MGTSSVFTLSGGPHIFNMSQDVTQFIKENLQLAKKLEDLGLIKKQYDLALPGTQKKVQVIK